MGERDVYVYGERVIPTGEVAKILGIPLSDVEAKGGTGSG